jgi:ferredoxin-NADP reductase
VPRDHAEFAKMNTLGSTMTTAHLAEVTRETPRTRRLRLAVAGPPFVFRAGQAAFVGVQGSGVRAAYSIASSPALAREGAMELLVAADSAFGQAGLDPADVVGARLDLDGPVGEFGVPDAAAAAPLLLVAGGTGIAPIRSVILDRLDLPRPPLMTLVYSARTPDEFAFVDELLALLGRGVLDVHMTVTRDDTPATMATRAGRVNDALLKAALPGPDAWCLVCGPAGFVHSATISLSGIGVAAERIVLER